MTTAGMSLRQPVVTALSGSEAAVTARPMTAAPFIIERITPVRALALSYIIWLVLYALTPISPRWPNDNGPLFLFAASTLTLVLGFAMPHILGIKFQPIKIGNFNFLKLYRFCLFLGALGLVLRLIDLLVFKNVELTIDIVENRNAASTSGASSFSAVAALFVPMGFAALVLSAVAVKLGIQRRVAPAAIVVGLGAMLLPVVFGSRSSLLLAAGQLGCLALLLMPQITRRMAVIGATTGGVMIFVLALLFMARLEQMGRDYKFTARYSAYTQVAPLQEDYLAVIDGAEPAVGLALTAYASILQYALHGLFEFFYLVELKIDNFSGGDHQFFFVSKMVKVVSGGNNAAVVAYAEMLENPRAGVFQSLFGPAYIDFGYFCIVFMFVFGFAAEIVRLRVRAGDYMLLPAHLYLLMTFLLAPIVSGVVMNAGSITLFSYLSLALMSRVARSLWIER
jgi:hypothetical protein